MTKTRVLCWVVLGMVPLWTSTAWADTTFYFTNYTGPVAPIDPDVEGPGPYNFTVELWIDTDVALSTASIFIRDLSMRGTATINSITWNDAIWDPNSEWPSYPGNETLNAGNSYTSSEMHVDAYNFNSGTGTFRFLTLDITWAGQTGQALVLSLTDITVGDINFDNTPATAENFVISVVPAPGAAVLGGIGLCMAGWLQKRRRRRTG